MAFGLFLAGCTFFIRISSFPFCTKAEGVHGHVSSRSVHLNLARLCLARAMQAITNPDDLGELNNSPARRV